MNIKQLVAQNGHMAHSKTGAFSATPPLRFLRLPHVAAMTGLSRSTIYRLGNEGGFPKPVRLGLKSVAWREDELLAWMQSCTKDAPPAKLVEGGAQ